MNENLFGLAFWVLMQNEGGLLTAEQARRVRDPGGLTNFGITQRTWERFGYSGSVEGLSEEDARRFYRAHFWVPVEALGEVCPGLLVFAFDYAVQSGPKLAIRAVQRAVGATPDGIVGPRTVQACGRHGAGPALIDTARLRRDMLVRWTLKDPRRLRLLRGLVKRVDVTLRHASQVQAERYAHLFVASLWPTLHA